MKKLFLMMALAFIGTTASATDNIENAKKFLNSLEVGELAFVAQMAHEDIVFEDPTFGAEVRGKDNVLKAYENYTGGVHSLSKHLLHGYESNNVVVLSFVFHAYIDVLGTGDENKYLPMMGEGIRVIRFKDGKIIRHTDLSDYTRLQQEMDAIRNAASLTQ